MCLLGACGAAQHPRRLFHCWRSLPQALNESRRVEVHRAEGWLRRARCGRMLAVSMCIADALALGFGASRWYEDVAAVLVFLPHAPTIHLNYRPRFLFPPFFGMSPSLLPRCLCRMFGQSSRCEAMLRWDTLFSAVSFGLSCVPFARTITLRYFTDILGVEWNAGNRGYYYRLGARREDLYRTTPHSFEWETYCTAGRDLVCNPPCTDQIYPVSCQTPM